MSSTDSLDDRQQESQVGLERLVFFSDAVFAIAITLLVLDIHLPPGFETQDSAQLFTSILGSWQKHLAYVISFLVIGTFWISHHRKFNHIIKYDRGLLLRNLLLMMVTAYIPFPTSVISENGNRTATILYASTIVVAGLLMISLWWYASSQNRLIDPYMSAQEKRFELLVPIFTVTLFVISIGIAFFNDVLAKLSWLLIIPATRYVSHWTAVRSDWFYKDEGSDVEEPKG
jgi:TMEM175 potassium channel family protein